MPSSRGWCGWYRRERRLVYIQHSPAFGFPDIITVEFVALGPDRSGIALYSRSRYGRNDFGKNRERVERWLGLLEKAAPVAASSPERRPALQRGAD